MSNTTNKVVSAKGELVDFDLLRIRGEIATPPTVIRQEPRTRKRRRLSERGSAIKTLATKDTPQQDIGASPTPSDNLDVDPPVEAPTPPAKIVRRKKE